MARAMKGKTGDTPPSMHGLRLSIREEETADASDPTLPRAGVGLVSYCVPVV